MIQGTTVKTVAKGKIEGWEQGFRSVGRLVCERKKLYVLFAFGALCGMNANHHHLLDWLLE